MQTRHSMDAATHAANAAKEAAAAAAHGAAAAAAGAAQDMVHGAKDTINSAFGSASGAVQGAAGSVHGAAGSVQGVATGAAEHLKNTVKDTIKDYFTSTSSSAKSAGSSASNVASNAAGSAADYLKGTVKDTVKESIKDYFWSGSKHKDKYHEKSGFFHMFSMWQMALFFTLFIVLLTGLYFMRRKSLPRPFRRLWYRTRTWIMNRRKMIMNLPILNQYTTSTVLICGPVDAGKTVLLHALSGTQRQSTQTSMEENVVKFKIPANVLGDKKQVLLNTEFEFIDFPGHPSQEFQLNKCIPKIKGVILLVDASSNDSYMRGAKMLYSFLENKQFTKKQIPILICANKTDLNDAATMTAIRTKILDELNKLRDSPLNVNTIEKDNEGIVPVGKAGERLSWENIGCPVSFGQISAKTGNIRDVIDFLEGIQHCCC